MPIFPSIRGFITKTMAGSITHITAIHTKMEKAVAEKI
jgi:hypothetical protein